MQKRLKLSDIPPVLTFYSGGLNLGVFYPGPPVGDYGSELLGNPFTGRASKYYSISDGRGNKIYPWLLIVAPTNIQYFQLRSSEENVSVMNNSNYDGYFNKQNMISKLKERSSTYNKGGYEDWYIPSRDELAFMAKVIPQEFDLGARFEPMYPIKYMSSTYAEQNLSNRKKTKKMSLLFSQSFDLPTYGDTMLVSDTKPLGVRFVRRVPVYII